MQLSFFGSAERQLLGVYNPPSGTIDRDAAVLICHPAPQEYMWSYRAMRQLAVRLCAAGFHVFRFDYFGTGDSAGAGAEVDLDQWRADVATALEELRDVSGVRRPSLVGFRLGATLAAQAKARVRDLVLWEPVVSGPEFLRELRAVHEAQFAHTFYPPPLPSRGPLLEILGHPLPAPFQSGLEALQLAAPFACVSERVLVVASEASPRLKQLVDGAVESGARAAFEHVPGSIVAGSPFLMSQLGQERIVKLLSERAA